jgi:hypothetical protein
MTVRATDVKFCKQTDLINMPTNYVRNIMRSSKITNMATMRIFEVILEKLN